MRKITLFTSILIAAFFVQLSSALAGNYPEKPLSLICWSSAGSGHDLMARMVAKVGEKYLGQPNDLDVNKLQIDHDKLRDENEALKARIKELEEELESLRPTEE